MAKKYGLIGLFVVLFVFIIIGITGLVIGAEVFRVLTEEQNKIANIRIDFVISDISEEEGLFGPIPIPNSYDVIEQIKVANKREDIKAIVLHIDSPGGEVIASREIYEAVKDSEKPVVAYIRKTGASGAYYVAAGSDYIVSEPEALTGSIGVMMGSFMSFEKMFDNLGIDYTVITSGDKKNMGDIGKNMTTEERAILQEIIDQIFIDFKTAVYEGRKGRERFNLEGFNEVTDGRIISGRTAYEFGLVDELGNKQKAFEKARELAGLETYEIVEIDESERERFFGKFAESIIKPIKIGITVEHKINGGNNLISS